MVEKKRRKFNHFLIHRSPTEILISGFAFVILFGASILTLPIATQSGECKFN